MSRGVHLRTPQVLLPAFALMVAGGYALRSGPPPVAPVPTLVVETAAPAEPPTREAVLYAVDAAGLARPIVRELPAPEDESERLQGLVDALREELVALGAWPAELPAPVVYAFELERQRVAVLDLPAAEVRVDVARERSLLASLERTLMEQGIERVAHLRGGRPAPTFLGAVAVPSGLD